VGVRPNAPGQINGGAMKLYVPEIPESVLMGTDSTNMKVSDDVNYVIIDEIICEKRHWTEKQRYDYYNMLRGRLAPTISTF
jgi:hypothetical protein